MEVTSLEEHLSELFDPQEAAPIEQNFRKSKTLELYHLEVKASNDWFAMIFAVLKYIVATYISFKANVVCVLYYVMIFLFTPFLLIFGY